MKKILAMALALAMSCSMLVACGEEDSSSKGKDTNTSSVAAEDSSKADEDTSSDAESSEGGDESSKDDSSKDDSSVGEISGEIKFENETPVETDERKFETLMSTIAKSGEFTVNCDIQQDGVALVMYVTTDGKSTYIDMNLMGIAITALSNADGDYLLDTANKKYYLDTTGSMGMESVGEEMIDSMTSLDDMTYSSTATATMNGKEYTIEKYLNNDTQIEVSYIFNADGDLVIVGNDEMYMPFEFKASVDSSKLTVDGYTAMTDEEFVAWSQNFAG